MDIMNLEDRQTGRSVDIRRPLDEYLAPDELIALEDVVHRWFSLNKEQQAEEDFDRIAAGSPERVLYGILWLTGLWCSLCHARLGIPVSDFIGQLDYTGMRRELSGMSEDVWATSNQVVRRGVLAVVTSDDDIREYLRLVKQLDPRLLRIRRHLLTILDGLTQDMARNGLGSRGAAAHIITGAGWAA